LGGDFQPAGAASEARMPSGEEFLPAFDAGGEILHCFVLGGRLYLAGILFDAERTVDRLRFLRLHLRGWSAAIMRDWASMTKNISSWGTGLPDVICVYKTRWQG
jgi:hypothetical protein